MIVPDWIYLREARRVDSRSRRRVSGGSGRAGLELEVREGIAAQDARRLRAEARIQACGGDIRVTGCDGARGISARRSCAAASRGVRRTGIDVKTGPFVDVVGSVATANSCGRRSGARSCSRRHAHKPTSAPTRGRRSSVKSGHGRCPGGRRGGVQLRARAPQRLRERIGRAGRRRMVNETSPPGTRSTAKEGAAETCESASDLGLRRSWHIAFFPKPTTMTSDAALTRLNLKVASPYRAAELETRSPPTRAIEAPAHRVGRT